MTRKFNVYDRGYHKLGDASVAPVRESLPYIGIARRAIAGKSQIEIDKVIDAALQKHKQMLRDGYQPTLEGYIPRIK